MSVPVPMAMPTSAAASAGASFTPSPAIATTRPSARRRLTTSLFRSGRTSASTSSMPSRRATALAVVRLSPVSMTMRRPSAFSAATTSGARRLYRIGDRRSRRQAFRRRRRRPPSRLPGAASRPPPRGCRIHAFLGQERGIADSTRSPPTLPIAPLPVGDSKSTTGPRRSPRSSAARTIASASGCSLARSTLAASCSTRLSSKPGAGTMAATAGRALRQRAGLVDHQRVDLLHALQRFGVLDEHAGLRAAADADHDRHRRREPERTRAGDDEHAHRRDQP